MRRIDCTIPFSGFYESKWSAGLDDAEESYAQFNSNESDELDRAEYPEATASELCEALYWVTDYRAAYLQVAREYTERFALELDSEAAFHLGLAFVEMVSPREYNFTTDRIFCSLPLTTVLIMRRETPDEILAEVIRERFTSCDGFISMYSNRLDEWDDRPVEEWDHNEVGTLLLAYLRHLDVDLEDTEWGVFYDMSGNGDFDGALDGAIDWAALPARVERIINERKEAA